jgi:hypothetical protein
MKQLVLSLWLIGMAYVGYTSNLLQQITQSSWEGSWGTLSAASSESIRAPRPPTLKAKSTPVLSVALRPDDIQQSAYPLGDSEPAELSVPSAKETDQSGLTLGPERDDGEVSWIGVLLAARVHSGPSVSARTIGFYPAGTMLHLIGYERGWFQIADPATSQQGWIFWKYLGAISGPVQARVASEEPQGLAPADIKKDRPSVRARNQWKKPRPSVRAKNQRPSAERLTNPTQARIMTERWTSRTRWERVAIQRSSDRPRRSRRQRLFSRR